MKVAIQNLAFKGYHEFHVSSHKDLEMVILAGPIHLLTRVILQRPYVRLNVNYWGGKKL